MHSWVGYCSLQIAEFDVFFSSVFNSLFLIHGTNRHFLSVHVYMKALPPAPNFFPSIYAAAGVRGERFPSMTVQATKGANCSGCAPNIPGIPLRRAGHPSPAEKHITKYCISLVPKQTSEIKILQKPVPMKVIIWIFKILNVHKIAVVLACVLLCVLNKRWGFICKRWLFKSGVKFLLKSLLLRKNYGKTKAVDRTQVLRHWCLVGKLHSIPCDLQFLAQKVMCVSKICAKFSRTNSESTLLLREAN